MKVNFHINSKLKEERAEFWIRKMSSSLSQVVNQLSQEQTVLWCSQDNEIIPVEYDSIFVLKSSANSVEVMTNDSTYQCKHRISQLAEILPLDFMESSRGTIINYRKIDHLELLGDGKIDVIMKNKLRIQMSRRKIKNLKEKLGL